MENLSLNIIVILSKEEKFWHKICVAIENIFLQYFDKLFFVMILPFSALIDSISIELSEGNWEQMLNTILNQCLGKHNEVKSIPSGYFSVHASTLPIHVLWSCITV